MVIDLRVVAGKFGLSEFVMSEQGAIDSWKKLELDGGKGQRAGAWSGEAC